MKKYCLVLLLSFSLFTLQSCLTKKAASSPETPKENSNNTQTKEELLTLAKEQFNKNDYEKAIKSYTLAIEKDPLSIDAYYGRGNSFSSNGNQKDALKDYTKAKDLSLLQDNYLLDEINQAMYKSSLLENIPITKDFAKGTSNQKVFQACSAEQTIELTLKILTSKKLHYIDIAKLFTREEYEHSKNHKAIELVVKALTSCRKDNDLKTAIKYIDEAISLDNKYAFAYRVKADILRDLNDLINTNKEKLNTRILLYKKVLSLSNEALFPSYRYLIEIYASLKNHQLVIDYYERFLRKIKEYNLENDYASKQDKVSLEIFYVNPAKRALKKK